MVLPANAGAGSHLRGPVEFYLSASVVELWCQGNTELSIRTISQDKRRERNRLINYPPLHWRKQTILIYSHHQTSYMQWDRSASWSTWKPAIRYPVTANGCNALKLSVLTPFSLQGTGIKQWQRKMQDILKKAGNRSSLWVLPLGQVIVRLFCVSNTLC